MHYHASKLATDPVRVYVERSLTLEQGSGYALKSEGVRHTLLQLKNGCKPHEWDVVALNRIKGSRHLPHYWRLLGLLSAVAVLLYTLLFMRVPNPHVLVLGASVLLIVWGSAAKFAFEEHVKVAIKLAPVHGHPLEDTDIVIASIPKAQYYDHFASNGVVRKVNNVRSH